MHELSDPPMNRHGQLLNGDYLSPSCKFGMDDEGCVSNACSCTCHLPKPICGAPCHYGGLEMTRRRSKSDLGWMWHCNRRVKTEGDRCYQHKERHS